MTEKAEGTRLFKLGNYKDAIPCYEEAVDSSPSDSEKAKLWSNVALCHYKLAQYQQGLVAAIRAASLEPKWAKASYRVAVGLHRIGDFRNAFELCKYAEALAHDAQERQEITLLKTQILLESSQECDPKKKQFQFIDDVTANATRTPQGKQYTLDVVVEEVNKALHSHQTGQLGRVLTRIEGKNWFMKGRKNPMRPMTPAQFYPSAENTDAQERAYWKYVCCLECQQRNIPVALAIQYLLDRGYRVTDRAGRNIIAAMTLECQTDPTCYSNPRVHIDGREHPLLEATIMCYGATVLPTSFAHHTVAALVSTWEYNPRTGCDERQITYVDLSAPQFDVMSSDKNGLPMVVSPGNAMSIGAAMPYVKQTNLPGMSPPGWAIEMYLMGLKSLKQGDFNQRTHHVNQTVATALSSLLGDTVTFDAETFAADEKRTLRAKKRENGVGQ